MLCHVGPLTFGRATLMELTFLCPDCGAVNRLPSLQAVGHVTCRQCAVERPLHRETTAGGQLLACPWCATRTSTSRRTSPGARAGHRDRRVRDQHGLLVPRNADPGVPGPPGVGAARHGSLLQVARRHDLLSLPGPGAGPGSNPDGRFQPFDLAVGERYRQERLRVEELRKRGATVEPPAAVRSPARSLSVDVDDRSRSIPRATRPGALPSRCIFTRG